MKRVVYILIKDNRVVAHFYSEKIAYSYIKNIKGNYYLDKILI